MAIKKAKRTFKYVKPTIEQIKKRQNQGAGNREGLILPEYKVWTPKGGTNTVRIMPPTWDNAEHYGLDVFVHYGIGPDNSSYICTEETKILGEQEEKCPCCQLRLKAQRRENPELADALKPNRRVLVWMVDRDRESDGPQVWPMAWTLDRDLALVANDKRTGEVYAIDDPEDGYDVDFSRDGSGINTKYTGLLIVRRSSPLADDEDTQDEWLEYITQNPLPDCLVVHDAEHVQEQLDGGMFEDKADRGKRGLRRSRDDDDDRSARRRSARDDDDEDDRHSRRGSAAASRRGSRDEEDDEEEERPARRSAGRGRSRVEDEDEEEEKPARRSAARGRVDEDEEEEKPARRSRRDKLDEDEEDEEEEVKPARGKAKRSKTGIDDEEDEEEAIRHPGRGRMAKTAPPEDEEEEEPPRKRSGSKSGAIRERLRSLK